MSISAKQVKELRERTGAGMMDCKNALVETNGDLEQAIELLQVKGITKAAKKSGRVAAEGLLDFWLSKDHKSALLIEVNCETDFVARNEQFQAFVKELVNTIGESNAETVEEALQLPFRGKNVDDSIKEQIATIGENIKLRRMARLSHEEGFVAIYIHAGSQLGVLVAIDGDPSSEKALTFGADIAMQIAGMRPEYISPEDVTEEDLAKQTEIFTSQVREEGKPENMIERIVKGKVDKWCKESALYEQSFVKNQDITVRQYEQEIGDVKVVRFQRIEVGEGIEKKESNLAEEVAAQLKDL